MTRTLRSPRNVVDQPAALESLERVAVARSESLADVTAPIGVELMIERCRAYPPSLKQDLQYLGGDDARREVTRQAGGRPGAILDIQVRKYGPALRTAGQRVEALARAAFLAPPELFEVKEWAPWVGESADRYRRSKYRSNVMLLGPKMTHTVLNPTGPAPSA